LSIAAALAAGVAACTTLIGLGDLDRVDCAADCGAEADGTSPDGAGGDGRGGGDSGDAASDQVGNGGDAGDGGAGDAGPGDGGHDSGGGSDGGSDGAPDSGYVDKGIRCGDAGLFCKPGGNGCCLTVDKCETPVSCGVDYMSCDDTADCVSEGLPNDVCCATVNGLGEVSAASCLPPGKCTGFGEKVLCDPKAPMPCRDGGVCAALSGGYSACK